MIELQVLGPPQVVRDGVNVKLQRKPLALLTYLTLADPPGVRRRDTLLGIFWPDHDQGRARTALRQPLYTLRITLLGKDGEPIDRVEKRIGLRAVELDTTDRNIERARYLRRHLNRENGADGAEKN